MLSCWIIVEEGLTGTENQCLGVAESFPEPLDVQVKRIKLKWPWSIFSPKLGFESEHIFLGSMLHPLPDENWPDLIIASGRKAVAAVRYIQDAAKKDIFTVFLQNPRISPEEFDLVAAPEHDNLSGSNVIATHGAPTRITKVKLENAKMQYAETLGMLPSPSVAVMIGGNSKAFEMTSDALKDIVDALITLHEQDYSLMITASRRTGTTHLRTLRNYFQGMDRVFYWDSDEEHKIPNPYMGFLACADFLLVTCDSISMISDCLTTGKPTYLFDLPHKGVKVNQRFKSFHDRMIELGYLQRYEDKLIPYQYTPLKDAKYVAETVHTKMNNKA